MAGDRGCCGQERTETGWLAVSRASCMRYYALATIGDVRDRGGSAGGARCGLIKKWRLIDYNTALSEIIWRLIDLIRLPLRNGICA